MLLHGPENRILFRARYVKRHNVNQPSDSLEMFELHWGSVQNASPYPAMTLGPGFCPAERNPTVRVQYVFLMRLRNSS